MTKKHLYNYMIIVLQQNQILEHSFLAQEHITYIVYTGIHHVTALLLVLWARFGFPVGQSDNELSFISKGFSRHKAESLCAVELMKLLPGQSAHMVAQTVG